MKILKKIIKDKKLAVNTSSLFVLNFLNFLLGIIILPELISSFGLKGWGQITLYQISLNYFIWFIDWSFPQYACKEISINENNKIKRNHIFITTRTSQLILFTLSSLFILLYSLVFSDNKLIFLCSILILLGSYLQPFWYYNGREKIYETVIFQLLTKVIFAFFVFNFIEVGDDIFSYFLFLGISNIITGIVCTLRLFYCYQEDLKIGSLKDSIVQIKNSYMLFNSSIIGNITNSSIPYLIGFFYNLDSVGIYNIADRIKNIAIQITHPISNSIFPRMSKYREINKSFSDKKFVNFLFFILITGLFIFGLLNINMFSIISFFTKEKIYDVSNVLRILGISFLINIIYEIFINQYLIINNFYKEVNKARLLILMSCIFIGVPLIYFKGLIGAAITNLIYELIGLVYTINIFKRTKNEF